jgi:sterol desaturase/sphingolipid hydroxylase (fatty acid hydroxylase superfamily)
MMLARPSSLPIMQTRPHTTTSDAPITHDSAEAKSGSRHIRQAVNWGLYPLLIIGIFAAWWGARIFDWPLSTALLIYAIGRFILLFACEWMFPAHRDWGMSWASFRRDLKYALVNGITMKGLRLAIAMLAIDASQYNLGLVSGAPLWIEVPAVVLTYEFFQYWVHRLSHSAQGSVGRFLWRVHAAHHLPIGVYLLMHPVGHPLNLALVMMLSAPLVLLGASSDAMFFFGALMGSQGLISHLNVNIRVGPLNYLLVGTELHRYHHSADLAESKNFGAMTPFWDIVFGTFVYRPGVLPQRLGVAEPEKYPQSGELLKVLALPFSTRNAAVNAKTSLSRPTTVAVIDENKPDT